MMGAAMGAFSPGERTSPMLTLKKINVLEDHQELLFRDDKDKLVKIVRLNPDDEGRYVEGEKYDLAYDEAEAAHEVAAYNAAAAHAK